MNARKPDWWSKSLAGLVLGLSAAFAASGWYTWFTPGAVDQGVKYQLAMWMIAPVWLTVLSLVYLFSSGLRAWIWLGGANAAAWSILIAGKTLMG